MRRIFLLLPFIAFSNLCSAEPIYCEDTDHWYEYINSDLDWSAASLATNTMYYDGMPGHLATVRSQAEHDFLCNNMPAECSPMCHFWLGGWRTNLDTPPTENWHWVTGEPWDWTPEIWGEDQPTGGDEWALELAQTHGCHWNDHYSWDGWDYHGTGFIVEYESDFIWVPDYGFSIVKSLY